MKRKKKGTKILWVLFLLMFAGFCVVGSLFLKEYLRQKQCDDTYDQLRDKAKSDGDGDGYVSPINFKKLGKKTRAWVVVPGTVIDYPVMQAKNNEYYLHHLANGKKNDLGAIFMDYRNNKDLTDKNSIMYGHWMKNKSMFAMLHKFKSQKFYKKHHYFTVYTRTREIKAEVFAVCIVPGLMKQFPTTFKSDEAFMKYIKNRQSSSVIKSKASVSATDQIITLTTCASEITNGRIAVYGVVRNIKE